MNNIEIEEARTRAEALAAYNEYIELEYADYGLLLAIAEMMAEALE